MSSATLTTVAAFDDIRRCFAVLTDGTAEEEFLRMLQMYEKMREELVHCAQDKDRVQKELDASLQSLADLEAKLFHARRLLEMESKSRKEAENERLQMEKKITAVADLIKNERNLNNETKDQLAFLTQPRKRKSLNPRIEEKYGNDINSTGSFLSDLSITQSEDDLLDVSIGNVWKKHRPSLPRNQACVGTKRARISGSHITSPAANSTRRSMTRRSGLVGNVQEHTVNIAPGAEHICATTKVTIPQDGTSAIRAESTIESVPMETRNAECLTGTPKTPIGTHFTGASAPPSALRTPRATLMRKHNFYSKTFIRAEMCAHCQKKIRFGSVGLRCRNCPIRCHPDCRHLLVVSCVPQTGTPPVKGMGFISEYAPNVAPMIPALIVHCVNEIDNRGLTEVGLYRLSGSDREVKALKELFLRGKNTPYLGNTDLHVLCGCIKDFLRSLREPLIPTGLWATFCNAVQNSEDVNLEKQLYKAIDALPQPNRDTLAFLILHLQRVAESREVLMPIDNLARVFGPTIVGYSSRDPDQHAVFTEVYTQFTVMQNLLKVPSQYWEQFVSVESETEKENSKQVNNILRTPSSKHKDTLYYSLYATPLKSTMKKRKFLCTPPCAQKK